MGARHGGTARANALVCWRYLEQWFSLNAGLRLGRYVAPRCRHCVTASVSARVKETKKVTVKTW